MDNAEFVFENSLTEKKKFQIANAELFFPNVGSFDDHTLLTHQLPMIEESVPNNVVIFIEISTVVVRFSNQSLSPNNNLSSDKPAQKSPGNNALMKLLFQVILHN